MNTTSEQKEVTSLLSEKLASEFQSVLQEQYGENVTLPEAQQIGLRIARFVFLKEVRRGRAI